MNVKSQKLLFIAFRTFPPFERSDSHLLFKVSVKCRICRKPTFVSNIRNRGICVNRPDDVCYIAELSDETYTKNDILSICKGNEEITTEVFNNVDWQSPEMEIECLIEIQWIQYNKERDTYERTVEDEE